MVKKNVLSRSTDIKIGEVQAPASASALEHSGTDHNQTEYVAIICTADRQAQHLRPALACDQMPGEYATRKCCRQQQ